MVIIPKMQGSKIDWPMLSMMVLIIFLITIEPVKVSRHEFNDLKLEVDCLDDLQEQINVLNEKVKLLQQTIEPDKDDVDKW